MLALVASSRSSPQNNKKQSCVGRLVTRPHGADPSLDWMLMVPHVGRMCGCSNCLQYCLDTSFGCGSEVDLGATLFLFAKLIFNVLGFAIAVANVGWASQRGFTMKVLHASRWLLSCPSCPRLDQAGAHHSRAASQRLRAPGSCRRSSSRSHSYLCTSGSKGQICSCSCRTAGALHGGELGYIRLQHSTDFVSC